MSERATAIPESVYQRLLTESPRGDYWDVAAVHELLTADREQSKRSTERFLADLSWLPQPLNVADLQDQDGRGLVALVADSLQEKAKRLRLAQWVVQTTTLGQATLVTLNDGRHSRRWRWINEPLSDALWRSSDKDPHWSVCGIGLGRLPSAASGGCRIGHRGRCTTSEP